MLSHQKPPDRLQFMFWGRTAHGCAVCAVRGYAFCKQVVAALTPVEASLLNARLSALEGCLEPGLTRLNWLLHSWWQTCLQARLFT